MAKILIGGDIFPTPSNEQLFCEGNAEKLIGKELLEDFSAADFRMFNLEGPLIEEKTPIAKSGPVFGAPAGTVNGLKNMNINLISIANNHIFDNGEAGLKSTIKTLAENNIDCTGSGNCLKEASKPYLFMLNGITIGVYSCAESEFSIATESGCGANPFDPLESLDDIAKLRENCDYLIVLYHGGKEFYRYPSPYLQKVCRKIVDKGADIVLTQHSHCIGCMEEYQGSTIVYGQGNFLLARAENDFTRTGLLVSVDLKKDNSDGCLSSAVDYIPVIKTSNTVGKAKDNEFSDILSGFFRRSEEIKSPGFLKNSFENFADAYYERFFSVSLGAVAQNPVFRLLNRLFGKKMASKLFRKKDCLTLVNLIRCEAHREVFIHILNKRIGKKP